MSIKSLVVLSALAGITAIPAVCFAQAPRPGAYLGGFLGVSAPQDTTVTVNEFNPVSTKDTTVEFDPGLNIGGTIGYDFGFFRLEGEMSYKKGQITRVTEQNLGTRYINADGDLGAFTMMMNGFFDLHNDTPVTPYLGGGVGFAHMNLSTTRGVDANLGVTNNHIFGADDDNVFAYQAGAGIEIACTRRLSVDLGYRYLGTTQASFTKNWPDSTNLRLSSNNAQIGFRVKF